MKKRIAINGFGRIGRSFLRILFQDKQMPQLEICAINIGPHEPDDVDLLFKYDSLMGSYAGGVSYKNNALVINDFAIKIFQEKDPNTLPWKSLNIDWVIEASGRFTSRAKAEEHLTAGAKNVLITAPALDEDITIIPGVNDAAYNPEKHRIISLGSCTTNCFAPMVKVIHEKYGIDCGLMTTVHAYTNDQVLLDTHHKDPRRARAAALNIIPTKTGADRVITKLFPELENKIRAMALRVPVPKVSLLDFCFTTKATISKDDLNEAFLTAARGNLKNILIYATKPLVSSDYSGNHASLIYDSLLTLCTGNMAKVFAWYDNEIGYSARLRDFLLHK